MASRWHIPQYRRDFDYRGYTVGPADEPLLSSAEVARMLGHVSTEGVRKLVASGALPAGRGPGYNARLRIPQWAADGLLALRKKPATDGPEGLQRQVSQLEETLALLLEAREHELRALDQQRQVAESLQKANDALGQALGRALVQDAVARAQL